MVFRVSLFQPKVTALSSGLRHPVFAILFLLGAILALEQTGLCASAEETWPINQGPSPAQVRQILDEAEANAWVGQSQKVTAHALRCYEAGNLEEAYAWHGLGRWIQYIGLSQKECMQGWANAMRSAKLDTSSVKAHEYRFQNFGTMAMLLPRELRIGIPSTPAMLSNFFENVSVYDCPVEVFAILKRLFEDDPMAFHQYYNLALAIAVVYDVPPPKNWPHGQVGPGLVANNLQDPVRVFRYFVDLDRRGCAYAPISQLPSNELKYLVDISATFEELEWAQRTQDRGLKRLPELYSSVHYRDDRIHVFTPIWNEGPYTLQAIQAKGGICIDQAYFTAQVGKALGVPTLWFKGAAMDLRHAWVGYFNSDNKWILDIGRSGQFSKSTIAWSIDPQTWANISEQDLRFFEDRHLTKPKVHEALIHLAFARTYLMLNRSSEGERGLRECVQLDPLSAPGWDLLLLSLRRRQAGKDDQLKVLREALKAMKGMPDMETKYSLELCSVLRTMGRGEEADKESGRLATKYRTNRDDLSAIQVSQILWAACQDDNASAQLSEYSQLMQKHAKNGGVIFMDIVVSPFVSYLISHGHKPEALQAVQIARGVLKVEPGGMIEKELLRLTGLSQP